MSRSQSQGFLIVSALISSIKDEPALSSLPLVRNPRRPASLNVGDQVLIVAEKADTFIERAGYSEKRRRLVTVGALSRTQADADADADALYQLVSKTVAASLKSMCQAGEVGKLTERDVQFHVDDLEVDGAIVVSGWEIEYRRERLL